MNLSELDALSDREIIDSLSRTAGTPVEKTLQAELERRHKEAILLLNSNISILNNNIEKLLKSNEKD